MVDPVTLIEIVERGLEKLGADGLLHPEGECACELSALMPCDAPCGDGPRGECMAAKKGPVPEEHKGEGHEWFMYPLPDPAKPKCPTCKGYGKAGVHEYLAPEIIQSLPPCPACKGTGEETPDGK